MAAKRAIELRMWPQLTRLHSHSRSSLQHPPQIQQQRPNLLAQRCIQISSTSPIIESNPTPDPLLTNSSIVPGTTHTEPDPRLAEQANSVNRGHSRRYDLHRAPTAPSISSSLSNSSLNASLDPGAQRAPFKLSPALLASLPHLTSQPPFYATIHIHGKPYLVTPGDRIRLPFLMHGVFPGDILRLDRVSILGSRDWSLRAGAPKSSESPVTSSTSSGEEAVTNEPIIGRTEGLEDRVTGTGAGALHFRAKKHSKTPYLDDRLFEIRATVLGTENEPLRVKEKTKRRQRHVRHVKSKLRYTILRVSEITVKGVNELRALEGDTTTLAPGSAPEPIS